MLCNLQDNNCVECYTQKEDSLQFNALVSSKTSQNIVNSDNGRNSKNSFLIVMTFQHSHFKQLMIDSSNLEHIKND